MSDPRFVLVTSDNCGHCKTYKDSKDFKDLKKLLKELGISFYHVNYTSKGIEGQKVPPAILEGITGVPHFMLVSSGWNTANPNRENYTGNRSAASIEEWLLPRIQKVVIVDKNSSGGGSSSRSGKGRTYFGS